QDEKVSADTNGCEQRDAEHGLFMPAHAGLSFTGGQGTHDQHRVCSPFSKGTIRPLAGLVNHGRPYTSGFPLRIGNNGGPPTGCYTWRTTICYLTSAESDPCPSNDSSFVSQLTVPATYGAATTCVPA